MRASCAQCLIGLLLTCGLPAFAGEGIEPADIPPGPQVNLPGADEDAHPGTLGLPVFPGSRHIPMDGSLSTGGVPQEALVFFTDMSVDEVLRFYGQDLESRKLRVTRHRFGPHSGYVGFYHPLTQTMRMATVQAKAGGGCMIVLSSMNPAPLLGNNGMTIPEGLPDLPGAASVVTTTSEQAGATHRTVYFEARGTPAEVITMLEQRGDAMGWKPAHGQKRTPHDGLTLQRGRETCMIRALPASNSTDADPSSSVTMVVIEDNKKKRKRQGRNER